VNLHETKHGYSVHVGASVSQFASIGIGCKIYDRVRIHSGASIGDNCNVGEAAIILNGARVGKSSSIKNNAVISESAVIGNGCVIEAGSFVGQRCRVVSGVTIAAYSSLNAGLTYHEDTVTIIGGYYDVTLSEYGIRIGCKGPFWPEDWNNYEGMKLRLMPSADDEDYDKYYECISAACELWHSLWEYR